MTSSYSTSIYLFVSGKCGKEVKKILKIEYLENKKSFLDQIKNTFHGFWRAFIWWKNKNLIKYSGHSFKQKAVVEKFNFSELKIVSYMKWLASLDSWALSLFGRGELRDKNQLLKKGKKGP